MATLKIVLSVLFIIVSVVITIVILFQEGKSAGLGTIAGVADTYWGKNKGSLFYRINIQMMKFEVFVAG